MRSRIGLLGLRCTALSTGKTNSCRWRKAHDKPCGYVAIGALMEAMTWTTGKVYKVEKVACIANGATNGVYRISKEAAEV